MKTIKCPSCDAVIDLEKEKSFYVLEKKYFDLQEKLELAIKQIDILNRKISDGTKKTIEDEL